MYAAGDGTVAGPRFHGRGLRLRRQAQHPAPARQAAGCQVTVVPAQTSAADVLARKPDGVFPVQRPRRSGALRLRDRRDPRGLIDWASRPSASAWATRSWRWPGAKTFKMKFGHHGANHPVKDLDSGKVVDHQPEPRLRGGREPSAEANLPRHARGCSTARCGGLAHRQAGVLLPGPPGSGPRPAPRHRLPVRPLRALMEKQEMPKRTDLKSILIIGAGPSSSSARPAVRLLGRPGLQGAARRGLPVILVNSNPATIMTDPSSPTPPTSSRITWQVLEASSPRSARRGAADHGRPDGAELRWTSGEGGRGSARRRDDRRPQGHQKAETASSSRTP